MKLETSARAIWKGLTEKGTLEQRPEKGREGSMKPPEGRVQQVEKAARSEVLVQRESGILEKNKTDGGHAPL